MSNQEEHGPSAVDKSEEDSSSSSSSSSSDSENEKEKAEKVEKVESSLSPEKPKSPSSVKSAIYRIFGRQKSVHEVFGGGKPADVFLWRNKKISGGVLGVATAVWFFFELLEYHLLTLVCHSLILSLVLLFLWSNAIAFINKFPLEYTFDELLDAFPCILEYLEFKPQSQSSGSQVLTSRIISRIQRQQTDRFGNKPTGLVITFKAAHPSTDKPTGFT